MERRRSEAVERLNADPFAEAQSFGRLRRAMSRGACRCIAAFALAACIDAAHGADEPSAPSDFDGTWIAHIRLSGRDRELEVVLKGDGGTWPKYQWANIKFDTCGNRPMPIRISRSTPDELVFHVERSRVIGGCRDSTFRLRKQEDGLLSGTARWDEPDAVPIPITLVRR